MWASKWFTPTNGRSQARERLRLCDADQQRADQSRAPRCRHRIETLVGMSRLEQGGVDDRGEQLEMGAARDLRHYPTEPGMQVDLARDDRREDLAPIAHDRRRGLVAGGLDPEDGRHLRAFTACSILARRAA
jgi:hypothetical protein